mmetsp:Transcript_32714/g.41832  ORF Transcript_32714/g.41832 Transcript_32714/m.41832 type:complete len:437 (+) Transcript_32714:74-1384(+)|eukprot:CAMPEP_0117753478 /NCGR_PEP_ID=MMETSP0947-20121206/12249_1 /TAXON_ID=44440 /ORGANISM="Chattonella subsalsa, Strain CCMP2191" /LENGTH=436 /DNA_ID=CAMNT_0005572367 /DNA_START=35 /DNA_END=1345 /DNA_ORIENTATION=+
MKPLSHEYHRIRPFFSFSIVICIFQLCNVVQGDQEHLSLQYALNRQSSPTDIASSCWLLLRGGISSNKGEDREEETPHLHGTSLIWEDSRVEDMRSGKISVDDSDLDDSIADTKWWRLDMFKTSMQDGFEGVVRKAEKMAREVKGMLSSEFEQTVLKATRPDDQPAKEKHVRALVKSVGDFPDYKNHEYNPYRVMLHKLWARLSERDWRTVCKALFVLHLLAQKVHPDHSKHFMEAMESWTRVYSRKSGSTYFSSRAVAEIHSSGQMYAEFLRHYAVFVFSRISLFSSEYDELWMISLETPHDKAAEILHNASHLIKQALVCNLGADLDNDVTCPCLELIVRDLQELWRLFGNKLLMRLEQRISGDELSNEQLSATLHFCEFYLTHLEQVQRFTEAASTVLRHYNIRIEKETPVVCSIQIIEDETQAIKQKLGYIP